jgi:mRNA interferase MazF
VEKPLKGDVVVVPFPFSDLTRSKRRPALVVADLPGEDLILCQITSRDRQDPEALSLSEGDFAEGGLSKPSFVRPARLFTADRSLVLYRVGRLRPVAMHSITERIVALFTR